MIVVILINSSVDIVFLFLISDSLRPAAKFNYCHIPIPMKFIGCKEFTNICHRMKRVNEWMIKMETSRSTELDSFKFLSVVLTVNQWMKKCKGGEDCLLPRSSVSKQWLHSYLTLGSLLKLMKYNTNCHCILSVRNIFIFFPIYEKPTGSSVSTQIRFCSRRYWRLQFFSRIFSPTLHCKDNCIWPAPSYIALVLFLEVCSAMYLEDCWEEDYYWFLIKKSNLPF